MDVCNMERTLRRRRLLQLAAATGTVALAGCLGDDDGDTNGDDANADDANGDDTNGDDVDNGLDDGEFTVRDYASYLAPDESNETSFGYTDFEGLSEIEDELGEVDGGFGEPGEGEGDGELGEFGDPLIDAPFGALFFIAFGAAFGIGTTGLGPLLEEEEEREIEIESTMQDILFANDSLILRGDIDTAEAETLLSTAEDAFQLYEPVDEDGEYTFYEVAGEGTGDQTIAVSAEDVIEGQQRSVVDEIVETKRGERERTVDQFPEFEWLLSTVEERQVALGGFSQDEFELEDEEEVTDDPLVELDAQPMGVMYSADFSAERIEAVAAISFDTDVTDQDESVMRDEFGTEAQEVEFTVDGNRVYILGTYDVSQIQ